MSVSDGEINVTEDGTYLISFFADGSVATGNFTVSLYVNDALVSGESIVLPDSAGAGSKSILLNLSEGDTVALYNSSTENATVLSASITAVKIA
jgi:hypothetical protein